MVLAWLLGATLFLTIFTLIIKRYTRFLKVDGELINIVFANG
jgi:hypothetical protein